MTKTHLQQQNSVQDTLNIKRHLSQGRENKSQSATANIKLYYITRILIKVISPNVINVNLSWKETKYYRKMQQPSTSNRQRH